MIWNKNNFVEAETLHNGSLGCLDKNNPYPYESYLRQPSFRLFYNKKSTTAARKLLEIT